MNDDTGEWSDDIGDATDSGPRHYVNHIDLAFSLSEVRINLGQDFPSEPGVRPQCRLVTSPVHLQKMEAALSRTLRNYKDRFGNIIQSQVADIENGGSHG